MILYIIFNGWKKIFIFDCFLMLQKLLYNLWKVWTKCDFLFIKTRSCQLLRFSNILYSTHRHIIEHTKSWTATLYLESVMQSVLFHAELFFHVKHMEARLRVNCACRVQASWCKVWTSRPTVVQNIMFLSLGLLMFGIKYSDIKHHSIQFYLTVKCCALWVGAFSSLSLSV